MKLVTVVRAAAWIGVVLVGWSINLRWGDDANLPPGPPATVERTVVGAMLCGLICALALSIAGRGGRPPGWIGKGVGLAGALGALALAAWVRSRIADTAVGGDGWMWMITGAATLTAAAVAAAALRPPADASQRNRGRRRAKGR